MYLEPQNIKNSVEFDNSELKPTILKDNLLQRLTVFAIFENQLLQTHTSPIDAVIFVIEGKIQITVNESNYEVNKDEIFMIPANAPHSVLGLLDSYFLVMRL